MAQLKDDTKRKLSEEFERGAVPLGYTFLKEGNYRVLKGKIECPYYGLCNYTVPFFYKSISEDDF